MTVELSPAALVVLLHLLPPPAVAVTLKLLQLLPPAAALVVQLLQLLPLAAALVVLRGWWLWCCWLLLWLLCPLLLGQCC